MGHAVDDLDRILSIDSKLIAISVVFKEYDNSQYQLTVNFHTLVGWNTLCRPW